MIQINTETKASLYSAAKNFITCPQCNKQDWFYSYIVRTCVDCGFYWGNIHALMDDIEVRKKFHKEGEIIENRQ